VIENAAHARALTRWTRETLGGGGTSVVRPLKTRLVGCVSSVLPPKFPGPAGGVGGDSQLGGVSIRERGRFSKPPHFSTIPFRTLR
jgi:hypothetical protein